MPEVVAYETTPSAFREAGRNAIRLLRRLAATGALRTLLTRPRVERVVATLLRSTTVHESAAFAVRELLRPPAVAPYRLRSSGRRVYVRHRTPDVPTLDEVFYTRVYELPAPVATALRARGRPPEVVDLGANIGLFGVFVLERFPHASITAFEPDRWNAAILRQCARANGASATWRLVEAAASNRSGTLPFSSGRYSLSKIAVPGDGSDYEHVAAVDVFPYLASADLIKMDIEGGEWPILADPRFAALSLTALVLEYHRYLCPEDDPHRAATRFLAQAGYHCHTVAAVPDGHGLLWAWRSV